MIKHVLVADGSVHANKAVAFGSDVAEKYGARLTLLHVMARAGSERVPEEPNPVRRPEKADDAVRCAKSENADLDEHPAVSVNGCNAQVS